LDVIGQKLAILLRQVVVSGHDTPIVGDAIPDRLGDLFDLVPEAKVLPAAEITWRRLQDLCHATIAVPTRAMTISTTMLVIALLPRSDHGSERRPVHGSVRQFRSGFGRARPEARKNPKQGPKQDPLENPNTTPTLRDTQNAQ